jgi:hypothetical protein
MEQDFDFALKHMGHAAVLATRARAPRLLASACKSIYNFGRIYDHIVKPPLKCDMRPFWLAGDCLLDALEGGWGEEGLSLGGSAGTVEEWMRDFICFTLEGLAGEHEFVNLVDLGERFNRLTKNMYAGILANL